MIWLMLPGRSTTTCNPGHISWFGFALCIYCKSSHNVRLGSRNLDRDPYTSKVLKRFW